MRRRELLRNLESLGRSRGWELVFIRHGGKHDHFLIGPIHLTIPRHKNINEQLARKMINRVDRYEGGN